MGSTLQLELGLNYGIPYRKNTEVEVLPVVDLVAASAKEHIFLLAKQHRCDVLFFAVRCGLCVSR